MKKDEKAYLEELKHHKKIVWINSTDIIGMFIGAAVSAGKLALNSFALKLPVIQEQPENILFDNVFYDPVTNRFGVVIIHESFDFVYDTEMPQELNGTLDSIVVDAVIRGQQFFDGKIQVVS